MIKELKKNLDEIKLKEYNTKRRSSVAIILKINKNISNILYLYFKRIIYGGN